MKIVEAYGTKYFYLTAATFMELELTRYKDAIVNGAPAGNDPVLRAMLSEGENLVIDVAGAILTKDAYPVINRYISEGILVIDSEDNNRNLFLSETRDRLDNRRIEMFSLPEYDNKTDFDQYVLQLCPSIVYELKSESDLYLGIMILLTRPEIQINPGSQDIFAFFTKYLSTNNLTQFEDVIIVSRYGVHQQKLSDPVYVEDVKSEMSWTEALDYVSIIPDFTKMTGIPKLHEAFVDCYKRAFMEWKASAPEHTRTLKELLEC